MTDGLSNSYRQRIWQALQACHKVDRAILFGSRAMGNFRPVSDVDLALEGRDLNLADLLTILRLVDQSNMPLHVDLVIRDKISNPDLERHIRDHGREWYSRQPA